MFFSHDLLCSRNARFAAIWLLAHAPPRSARPRSVATKDINIPRACTDILQPPAPMSLRFVSSLMLGLAQTLLRQAAQLYADAHAARSRIVSAPWVAVTRSNANDHLLPPAQAIARVHVITLPDALVPEYPNCHASSEHWILMSTAHQTPRLRACQQLGWLANSNDSANSASTESCSMLPNSQESPPNPTPSYTAAWDDISIPDPDHVRRALPPTSLNSSPDLVLSCSESPPAHYISTDHNADMPLSDHREEQPSFHFDPDGNLLFADSNDHSHNMSLDADPHTQLLGHYFASNQPDIYSRDEQVALEAAENDVLAHADNRPFKRQRVFKRQPAESSSTFVSRVSDLWANTCYWHTESQPLLRAKFDKSTALCLVARQLQIATATYSVPDLCLAAYILEPPYQAPDSPSPALDAAYYDDNDDALELELGRAAFSPTQSPRLHTAAVVDGDDGNEHYPDIHLDIPWLNPNVFNPRLPVGQAFSIRAESSPEPAASYHSHHHSVSNTSRAPSLDPPSSDDGIEIQSFHLAAHNLEAPDQHPHSDEHGLDSFLDASQLGCSSSAADAFQLDKDSASFRQFALTRMADQASDRLVFDDLLLHPYRNRRVAARAFTDLLQMATKSVFAVNQFEPFATITITKF
ncbi:R8 protein [Coemansia aciculifera]|uniref:R8 protein n=1 Tax=Coemansia aciculifera TaxID=417176 RepID=A0ACC1M4H8_9FUNG|nr:R8 protein [Coemansia aciculifera]